jgi:DNA mismatch repair ATPase MutS
MKNNIDLLYPEGYKKSHRRNDNPSVDYISNIELDSIASVLSRNHRDYAMKILCEICSDPIVIKYRQDILQDFIDNPKLEVVLRESILTLDHTARAVEKNFGACHSFFELNENLKVLKSYMHCLDKIHELYETSYSEFKSDGIKMLMELLEKSYQSKHYNTIREEVRILSLELAKGVKSITVGINLDDEMRPFQTALLSINSKYFRDKGLFDNLTYNEIPKNTAITTMTSLYDKNGALNYTNKIIFDELNKIAFDYRKHLNKALLSFAKSSAEHIIELAAQIDFYTGAKHLKELMESRGLSMCRPEIVSINERVTHLEGVYNLIFANKSFTKNPKLKIVANACEMNNENRIFILTGANNGGKTTYARGVGICHILAQAGLYVPAQFARISPVDYIFTHFPKEEEVGVNTSRFTEECKDLKHTVERASKYSLVLLNESI